MALDAAHRGYVLETGTIALEGPAKELRQQREGAPDLPGRGVSEPARPACRSEAEAPRLVQLPRRRSVRAAPVLATVFLCGGVLLGVEMAASRVLAPYFGNSLFVWASIIGVILGGLAAGYWLGGDARRPVPVAADARRRHRRWRAGRARDPAPRPAVIEAVLAWDPGPRLDPVLCTAILFLPMAVLLSAVGPIAVRLQADALQRVGRTAGRTFAISTAGSIAGTFVTAFWLIPELGVEQLFVFGAAALFATAALVGLAGHGCAWSSPPRSRSPSARACTPSRWGRSTSSRSAPRRRRTGRRSTARAATATSTTRDPRAVVPVEGLKVVFAEDTRYHRLAVVDDADTRYLRFDNSLQSAMYLDDPFRTRYRYTDLFHLGLAYNPDARDVLFVGLGAGSSEKRMWRDFPASAPAGRRARPRRRRRRLPLLRAAARPAAAASTSATDAASSPATSALGRDRDRRLLRRRDPGAPRHAGVPRARPLAARARRRRRHQRDRRARGAGLAALPLDLQDVPHRVPDGARPSRDPAGRPGRRAVPEPDPGRDRQGGAAAAAAGRALGRGPARDADARPTCASRSSTATTPRSRPTTCRC